MGCKSKGRSDKCYLSPRESMGETEDGLWPARPHIFSNFSLFLYFNSENYVMDNVRLVETLDPYLYQVRLGNNIIGHVSRMPELTIQMNEGYAGRLKEVVRSIKSRETDFGIRIGSNYFLPSSVKVYIERCPPDGDACIPGASLRLLR
jgi:hypothetical protein